jgi:hypothetical protein
MNLGDFEQVVVITVTVIPSPILRCIPFANVYIFHFHCGFRVEFCFFFFTLLRS